MEWVRLKDNPKVDKFIKIVSNLKDYFPAEGTEELKHYPYKYKSGEEGVISTRDYWCKSEAKIFADRIIKKIFKGSKLILFSELNKNYNFSIRTNTLIYVNNINYGFSLSGSYIEINGIDINFKQISLTYKIYELKNIVYKIIEDESFFTNILKDKPEPCYECIKVTKEMTYKEYLKDCKKFNFKSLPLEIFKMLNFTDYNGKDIVVHYFNKERQFVNLNPDYKIVN